MVTAMEDACPNGVREEAEMTPPGQPGMAMLSTQEPDTAGGEERRRKRVGCHIVYLDEQRDTVVFDFGFNFDDEMEGLMEGFYENKKKSDGSIGSQVTFTESSGCQIFQLSVNVDLIVLQSTSNQPNSLMSPHSPL